MTHKYKRKSSRFDTRDWPPCLEITILIFESKNIFGILFKRIRSWQKSCVPTIRDYFNQGAWISARFSPLSRRGKGGTRWTFIAPRSGTDKTDSEPFLNLSDRWFCNEIVGVTEPIDARNCLGRRNALAPVVATFPDAGLGIGWRNWFKRTIHSLWILRVTKRFDRGYKVRWEISAAISVSLLKNGEKWGQN